MNWLTGLLPALDWRRWIIYTHRWLGIAGCLIFIIWFASGVVMVYARLPRLTAEERLFRLTPVEWSSVRVTPEKAAARLGLQPERFRIGMLGDRPVYRFLAGGTWSTVFADSGEDLRGLSKEEAIEVIRRFMPEHAATLRYAGHLTVPDQWLLDGGLPRFLPVHRIALGDAERTYVYVSDRTGEAVMKTTARGRFWGYMGAVLHWTYFTPFRLKSWLWRWSIIWAALIGCVLCVSGVVIGIWRYSPSRRFRLKGERSHSPYAGMLWWHHYAGLVFGLFSFTWALSGALSLTPWDWAPGTAPTPRQVAAVAGGPFRLNTLTFAGLRAGAAAIDTAFASKEFEVLQFAGQPYLMAYRPPETFDIGRWNNPDLRAVVSAQLRIEHRLAAVGGSEHRAFTRFPDAAVLAVARAAMPGVAIEDATWLDEYDAYYYDRRNFKTLPVLRVRYADPSRTWLYLDPQHGSILLRHERLSRVNRWIYHGLHSLDFPFLYRSRPAWDIVVILLSAGGFALSMTTLAPAWRRLKRLWRALLPGVTSMPLCTRLGEIRLSWGSSRRTIKPRSDVPHIVEKSLL